MVEKISQNIVFTIAQQDTTLTTASNNKMPLKSLYIEES